MSIIIRNCDSAVLLGAFRPGRNDPKRTSAKPYGFSFIIDLTLRFSMDSDLEAFSHNPTDGSVTALAVQPTVVTKYLIQRFLSY